MTEDEIERELARLDSLSDEEILAEAEARGVDTKAQAARVRELLLDTAKRVREAKARLSADKSLYKKLH